LWLSGQIDVYLRSSPVKFWIFKTLFKACYSGAFVAVGVFVAVPVCVIVGVMVGVGVNVGVGEGGGTISGRLAVLPSTVAYWPHSQQVTDPFLMIQ
jgi:hypothetical protein